MFRPRGIGIDIDGDGIPDLRVGPFGQVRPDIGMAFMGRPYAYPPYPPMYPMGYRGAGIDIDGDGIPDLRVGPYGQVRPDIGMFVHGPVMAPPYYPTPYY